RSTRALSGPSCTSDWPPPGPSTSNRTVMAMRPRKYGLTQVGEVLGEALPELVAGLGVVGVDGPDVRLPLGGVPVQVLLGVGEGESLPARAGLQQARADLVAVAGQPGLRRHRREGTRG